MPSPLSVPVAYFAVQATNISTNGSVNTSDDAGVEVPQSKRHERVHFACDKNGAATVDIYGHANYFGAAKWLFLERISYSRTEGEVTQLEGMAAFKRLQSVVNSVAAGVYVLNVAFGFSE